MRRGDKDEGRLVAVLFASLSAWMIEYDGDLVSDSSLTLTVVRKRLERCVRGGGGREREGAREGVRDMKEDRWVDLDTAARRPESVFNLSSLKNERQDSLPFRSHFHPLPLPLPLLSSSLFVHPSLPPFVLLLW